MATTTGDYYQVLGVLDRFDILAEPGLDSGLTGTAALQRHGSYGKVLLSGEPTHRR